MKLQQYTVLQLVAFLEKQDLKNFSNLQTLRKINGAIDQLKSDLGKYYKHYSELEGKFTQGLAGYMRKAGELRAKLSSDAGALQEALAKLQQEADKDKAIIAADRMLKEFKDAEDSKEIEFEIKNPEYKLAVKDFFEQHALEFKEWGKATVVKLMEFLGIDK